MAGRYVPPHLRKKSASEATQVDVAASSTPPWQSNPTFTLEDIHHHFWPISEIIEDDNGVRSSYGAYSSHSKTMHGSAETPDKLAFIVLFVDKGGKPASPRWEADQIIFTKSSLELLPPALAGGSTEVAAAEGDKAASSDLSNGSGEDPAKQAQSAKSPIAVFKQQTSAGRRGAFQFEGWYQIQHIAFLEPHSDELIRMLDQKWTRTDRKGRAIMEERRPEGWQKSLQLRWAVIKLVKDAEADRERGVPLIERLPEKQEPRKSVNEMLAEMRMKDGAGVIDVVDEPEDRFVERNADRTGRSSQTPQVWRAETTAAAFVEIPCGDATGIYVAYADCHNVTKIEVMKSDMTDFDLLNCEYDTRAHYLLLANKALKWSLQGSFELPTEHHGMARFLPIPVVLFGKSPDMARRAVEKLRPEYEVVETFNSFQHVSTRLPPLLTPTANPVSGESRESTKTPQVVIVGGAFTPEEINLARQLPHSDRVSWLQDNKFRAKEEWQAMTSEDLATDFVDRVKLCLREHGVVPGADIRADKAAQGCETKLPRERGQASDQAHVARIWLDDTARYRGAGEIWFY